LFLLQDAGRDVPPLAVLGGPRSLRRFNQGRQEAGDGRCRLRVSNALQLACRSALAPERRLIGVEQRRPIRTVREHDSSRARVAEPEASPHVNERIAELTNQFEPDATSPPLMVFCECGREHCTTAVAMTLSEYEAVRAGVRRWVVSSAHIDALQELARRNGYALIEKAPDRLSAEALAPRKESKSPTADLSQH
jgi:hypothetical protein